MKPRRALLSWSSGKDSAWTLHVLRGDPDVEVVGLLTTVNTTHGRVAMHSTRRAIVEAQARAAGLPLHVIPLPWPCSNEVYERAMRGAIESALKSGVTHFADLVPGGKTCAKPAAGHDDHARARAGEPAAVRGSMKKSWMARAG